MTARGDAVADFRLAWVVPPGPAIAGRLWEREEGYGSPESKISHPMPGATLYVFQDGRAGATVGARVATVRTDSRGEFYLAVPRGHYVTGWMVA